VRTYGRVYSLNEDGSRQSPQPSGFPYWVVVQTDANGFNDMVYLTTLLQVLQLNLNESPFFANYGLPDKEAVIQQVAPDYYMTRTQLLFAQFFASLIISRMQSADDPTYLVNVTTHQGVKLNAAIPIPE
jgi:hypothetical protein